MDSTCLQRLRRREMEGGYTIPRRTCRGRPIVCPGPCNPRFKTSQRQEIRYNAEAVKSPQYSQATETAYAQVYGQATTFEQGIMYEEITYGADGQTLETVAVDRMTTYNEVTLQTTSSKQFLPEATKTSKGSSPASGQAAPRSEARSSPEATTREQADDPSATSPKPITVDGGTTGGSVGVRAETPVGTSTDTPTVQNTSEMTGADCTRCLFMCLKAFVLAVVRLVRKLGGTAGKVEPPACFIGLTIFVVFHGVLAAIAWQMPQYQVFLSSQICGILAAVSWGITGTIPLLDPTPTLPSCVCRPCA